MVLRGDPLNEWIDHVKAKHSEQKLTENSDGEITTSVSHGFTPTSPSTDASLRCPGVKVYPVDTKWQDVIKDEEGVLFSTRSW